MKATLIRYKAYHDSFNFSYDNYTIVIAMYFNEERLAVNVVNDNLNVYHLNLDDNIEIVRDIEVKGDLLTDLKDYMDFENNLRKLVNTNLKPEYFVVKDSSDKD